MLIQTAVKQASHIELSNSKLYVIAANHINQAVLGFAETTTNFKKQQQLPKHVMDLKSMAASRKWLAHKQSKNRGCVYFENDQLL